MSWSSRALELHVEIYRFLLEHDEAIDTPEYKLLKAASEDLKYSWKKLREYANKTGIE